MSPWLALIARSTGRRAPLADVSRLQNDVIVVLRELLNIITELHEPGRLVIAAAQIKFSCCWQAVRSADSATGLYHKALPDHDGRVLTVCCSMWHVRKSIPSPTGAPSYSSASKSRHLKSNEKAMGLVVAFSDFE